MKKRLLTLAIMIVSLVCIFAITASAESKIIKLDTLPTLEEIHANPSAYISRIDALEEETTYKTTDPDSVVVLSDLKETPTYYVYPAYYFIKSTTYSIASTISAFNSAISTADSSAFAGYTSAGGTWGNGECDYLIRLEMPKYVTSIQAKYKFEGSANLKEIYFPTRIVTDEETGLEKEVTYVTSVSGENLLSSCPKLEYVHNSGKLPIGIVQGNNSGATSCNALKKFEIPYGVTSIPSNFFQNCYNLTEIVIPNTVTTLGKLAFGSCSKLEKVVLGAGMTTFYSPNRDFETFSGCNSLKFVYLPATFADSIQPTKNYYQNIFSQSGKAIYFITENDYDKVVEIQNKFITTATNGNIANATIELYDETKDYTAYQATLSKSVIVYGYNKCEAFYNGEHDYKGTGLCLDGVSCDMCKKSIAGTTEHNFNETIEYANGYTQAGVYCKDCTNEGCTALDVTRAVDALFGALAENGYSSNGTGIAFGGYTVNTDALKEFNNLSATDITYGVVIMNPKYVGDSFFTDGNANASKGFIVADMSASEYSNIKVMIDGLGANKSLELVIALYAYTDSADVEFIQSEDTNSACSSVEKADATLYTVSLNSVVDKPNTGLDMLPPYNKENA